MERPYCNLKLRTNKYIWFINVTISLLYSWILLKSQWDLDYFFKKRFHGFNFSFHHFYHHGLLSFHIFLLDIELLFIQQLYFFYSNVHLIFVRFQKEFHKLSKVSATFSLFLFIFSSRSNAFTSCFFLFDSYTFSLFLSLLLILFICFYIFNKVSSISSWTCFFLPDWKLQNLSNSANHPYVFIIFKQR